MAGIDEKYRRRMAAILFLMSGIMIVAGLAIIKLRRGEAPPQPTTNEQITHEAQEQLALAQVIQRVLLVMVVLVIIFAFGALALVRWSRHFHKWLLREPRPPTPVEDVWAMHRLPEESESTDEDDMT